MRFTSSNALIASTVALLSLITPVVSAPAAPTATITSPTAGQTLHAFESVQVEWTVEVNQVLSGVLCNIGLLHVDDNPSVPPSPGILQSNVPILNRQSSGPVTIPDVVAADNYFLELLSLDGNTVFATSGTFSIF